MVEDTKNIVQDWVKVLVPVAVAFASGMYLAGMDSQQVEVNSQRIEALQATMKTKAEQDRMDRMSTMLRQIATDVSYLRGRFVSQEREQGKAAE